MFLVRFFEELNDKKLFNIFIYLCFFYGAYYYFVGFDSGDIGEYKFLSYIKESLLFGMAMYFAYKYRGLHVMISIVFLLYSLFYFYFSGDIQYILSLKVIILASLMYGAFMNCNINQKNISNIILIVFLVQIPFIYINTYFDFWPNQAFGTVINHTNLSFFLCFSYTFVFLRD